MSVTDVDMAVGREADAGTNYSALAPDTLVEVRSSFDQRWTSGFAVAESTDDGYRLRRLSDGATLPTTFARDDIRRERRRGQWWY